ncbi:MAG: glycoside hydrolase family 1 protein [Myxococcota bacterium]
MLRVLLGLLFASLAAACSDERSFPSDFRFGTAVAGFQVDMGCPTIPAAECEDRRSDWYAYVTSTAAIAKSQTHLSGDPVTNGPGFFELYEADLDRAKDLGLTAFRFSLEWSRIFPESTAGLSGYDALKAKADPAALTFYHALLSALKARGLKPLVTLHHYTLPAWIHDGAGCTLDFEHCHPRGWLEPTIVEEIAKYAGFAAQEFGAEVDEWATLNEPMAVVIPGFLFPTPSRTNPPAQLLQTEAAKTALLAMIHAHARMVDAVRENDRVDADGDGKPTFIGIVYPVAPVRPKDPENPLDVRAATNISYIYNDVFMNAVLKGSLDAALTGKGEVQADLVDRADYLGLNYYFKVVVVGAEDSFLPAFSPLLTFDPLELEQGAMDPEGLYDVLIKLKETYPATPILITENGADQAIAGGQDAFMVAHLKSLLRAMHRGGVDVRGYFWWSLMDNYEWNQGTGMKFGLFGVDPGDKTKARTRRPAADRLQSIARDRRLAGDLGPL